RCLAGRDARREPQTNSRTIRKARNKADRPAKHRPEGFARKVPSCGVTHLVEQNERSTFVARLASEHFSCKRGSQRVLHQPASVADYPSVSRYPVCTPLPEGILSAGSPGIHCGCAMTLSYARRECAPNNVGHIV